MSVNVHEAKSTLSQLLARVEAGEEIIIARAGVPVARLCPLTKSEHPARVLGRDAGLFTVPDDLDDPLPDAVLAGFLG